MNKIKEEIEESVKDLLQEGVSKGYMKVHKKDDKDEAYSLITGKQEFIDCVKQIVSYENPDDESLKYFSLFLESKYTQKCFELYPEFMSDLLEQEFFIQEWDKKSLKKLWTKIYNK